MIHATTHKFLVVSRLTILKELTSTYLKMWVFFFSQLSLPSSLFDIFNRVINLLL